MTSCFSPLDAARLAGCLARLLPHMRLDRVALTGGMAMELGLAGLGHSAQRHTIADLDFVATSVDAIAPSAVGPFLVSHYHVVRPGVPKFMVQLVDPVSAIRIDIFPDLVGSLVDASPMVIGEHSVRVLPLERIFEHKLQTLSWASRSAPTDSKHVRDARVLADVLGQEAPDVSPEVLAADVYGTDADRSCRRCELSGHPQWPLAPKDRIFETLGWKAQPNIRLQPTAAGAIMSRRG